MEFFSSSDKVGAGFFPVAKAGPEINDPGPAPAGMPAAMGQPCFQGFRPPPPVQGVCRGLIRSRVQGK